MASLPTGWFVVGIGLLVLTVVSLLLCAFKWREAAMLKKEVLELRDTMRMMRYEEANLSRMLHTADKSGEEAEVPAVDEPVEEGFDVQIPVTDAPASEEPAAEEPIVEEPIAEEPAVEESVVEESVEESVEEESVEDTPIIEEPVVEDFKMEEPVEETNIVEEPIVEEPVVEEPVAPKTRKQAINERRPAIPNDLFAAWFEENEPIEPKETVVPTVAKQKESSDEQPEIVQEEQTEVPVVEEPVTEIPVVAAVSEESVDENNTAQLTVDIAPKAEESVELNKEDERFCRKLERIVNARMRNPNLNIDVIASQFGMGRTNFYRKVRELMDMSPNDYLRKCRMERAAELLQSTEMNVTDVCAQVGMPDAQYFSRVFKAYFGMPPSAYREKQ